MTATPDLFSQLAGASATGVPTSYGPDGAPLSPEAQLAQLTDTLRNIALSIKAAESTGQTDAALALRQQWRDVYAAAIRLQDYLRGQDTPGSVALALSSFSESATQIATDIGEGTAGLAKSATKLLDPTNLIILVVILVVGYIALQRLGRSA